MKKQAETARTRVRIAVATRIRNPAEKFEDRPLRLAAFHDFLEEAAESAFETLLDAAVGPDDDGNHVAILAGFVQSLLAELDAPLFVSDSFGLPFGQELHAGVASADGVDDGNWRVHSRIHPRFGIPRADDNSSRISLIDSLRQSGNRGVMRLITARKNSCLCGSGTVANVAEAGKFIRAFTSSMMAANSACAPAERSVK